MKPPVFVSICTLQRRSWLESDRPHPTISDLSLQLWEVLLQLETALLPEWQRAVSQFLGKKEVESSYLRGQSAPGSGWWWGPSPPQRTHQNPRGSFYWGWELPESWRSPPAAAGHTCPDCPKNASATPPVEVVHTLALKSHRQLLFKARILPHVQLHTSDQS